MDQSLTIWLMPVIALLVGIGIGFLIARLMPGTAPNRVQRQLDELQQRFDSYQHEVTSHFSTTAGLVKKLTQNYQDVQRHLSEGADRLALDELTRQRLQAALHSHDNYPSPRDRLDGPAEAPKDYAPKGDTDSGLDEAYGLKNHR
ncbi:MULTISPECIES: YhcB family protein [Pseudomonas]|uniref:YhcB family protein n=1 Tax=Pseudomonas TaxID=286 RepID=UPI000EFB22F4|nr:MULTISPECIES: DUF1043 family protein [Pseudomonas]MBA1247987.1 DUF1043 family protein [Pseudomonas zeshuii]AYN95514.1 DUF1043 family protein [Pseudomonas sp. LTJR-52]MBW5411585.1 DUF1043 family protein [Pseudomonas sp. MAG002Y]MCG7372467.1 DUF1043 family protein [Pseudomonas luteola]MDN3233912.1 DUF1043 family protein [Pseudomonas sp. WAC2]